MTTSNAANFALTIINETIVNALNANLINTADDLLALVAQLSEVLNMGFEQVKEIVLLIADKVAEM